MKHYLSILSLLILFSLTTINTASHLTQNISTLTIENQYEKQNLIQQNIQQKQRILTVASQPFKINYVITSWLQNYNTRSLVCRYLCQSDSLFSFFQTQACYKSYNCTNLIFYNLFVIFMLISYVILPIFMILSGIWNFKCLSQYLAVLTGVIILSSIYNKFAKQFEQTMQTDYDISSSEISSQIQKNKDQQIMH